jgi:hypothetical protein
MSKSAGASVNKQTENSQTGVDPTTMAWMKQMWDAAQAAGQAGPSGLTTGAADYNSGLMGAGQKGLAALSGDAGAAAGLMNPYQSQVVDAANQQWNQTDARTTLNANDAATRAGAFGGARHGIMEGTALAQNNQNRNAQIGGLLSSGYDQTMNRAGTLAGMGFAGAGANANLGMGGVGNPQQWLLEMLKKGYNGPSGTTSSGAQTGVGAKTSFSTNPFG